MTSSALLERWASARPQLIGDVERLVRRESPSDDLDAVAASADTVGGLGRERLGAEPERLVIEGRTHLRWRFGDGPRRVLVLGHHDTVWPLGTLDSHPWSDEGEILRGPGCFDMKCGVVMAMHAIAAQDERDGITLLVTGDEELGSPTSRELIESEASGCAAAFVLEAAADGGALKIERKGVSLYTVQIHGRAAHAGLEPENGVNAGVELAHQLLAVAQFGDAAAGTTVTPTVIACGTTSNTVPAHGRFAVDVRVRTVDEQRRVDEAMHALRPVLDTAVIVVDGGPNRPPLERAASRELFELATSVADRCGLPAPTAACVGGASDGNFTAAIGTPTLDGLGASGGGAHADSEHVLAAELPARTALLTELIRAVLAGDGPAESPAATDGRR